MQKTIGLLWFTSPKIIIIITRITTFGHKNLVIKINKCLKQNYKFKQKVLQNIISIFTRKNKIGIKNSSTNTKFNLKK
jgi:hypothetical protein